MIKETQFQDLAIAAKNGCLISRLLKIDVSMDATVDSSEPIRIGHIAG
jgi:organic hydroperoxide reductase OsmC/OhrA